MGAWAPCRGRERAGPEPRTWPSGDSLTPALTSDLCLDMGLTPWGGGPPTGPGGRDVAEVGVSEGQVTDRLASEGAKLW